VSAEVRRPTVLVTDVGRGSSVAIIRSLAGCGWRVIAGDASPSSVGFHSRHVRERFIYPSPTRAPGAFVEAVLDGIARWSVDLVIPVTDAAMLPLSAERERIPGSCRVAMPDREPLRLAADKDRTLAIAADLGIPVPRSQLMDSAEAARQAAAALGLPLVLKPISSRTYRDRRPVEAFEVSYASRAEDVLDRWHGLQGRVGILAQEYCAGEGHGVGLLMHEGRPLAAFQHRRIHEVPLTGGPSSLRESVKLDPVLYDYSVRLLAALRWTGLAMVEFKVGREGPKLMEINGRVWGSLPLAVMSGVDFPRLLGELYLQGPPAPGVEPQLTYRTGVRARNLGLDLVWIASALGGRGGRRPFPVPGPAHGVGGLIGLLDPRCRLDLLSLRDPGPAVAELPLILRKLWTSARAAGLNHS